MELPRTAEALFLLQVEEQPSPECTDPEVLELSNAFSSKLLTVTDIDAEDKNNPQLVSEYVNEIYVYMKNLEVGYHWFSTRKYYLMFSGAINIQETSGLRAVKRFGVANVCGNLLYVICVGDLRISIWCVVGTWMVGL